MNVVKPMPQPWAKGYNRYGDVWGCDGYIAQKFSEEGPWVLLYNQAIVSQHEFLQAAMEAADKDREARILSALDLSAVRAEARQEALGEAARVVDEHYAAGDMGNPGHHIHVLMSSPPRDAVKEAAKVSMDSEWQPISTCPYATPVDVWCVYGGEEFAQYDGGAPIGKLVSDRFRSQDYEWFGNHCNEHLPNGHASDLIPVAWRSAVPFCPPELIAKVLNLPLTREEALRALSEGCDKEDR